MSNKEATLDGRTKQSKPKSSGGAYDENTRYCWPLDIPASAWPPLRKSPPAQTEQQKPPPSSLPDRGMRAVFLHVVGAKKEFADTGVFLPCTVGNKRDPKKKTGCSTILVPDRVVQALNLNLEDFVTQPRFPGGFVLSHDVLIGRSNAHKKTPPHAAGGDAGAIASSDCDSGSRVSASSGVDLLTSSALLTPISLQRSCYFG